jgi:uncharacterized protein (TIGR03435 family)
MTAYDVKEYQISGPAWMATERYDVSAKVPAGTTREQAGTMWQSLLADRFGMVLHHEPKEFQVEEMVVDKGGAKLKESADDPAAPVSPCPPRFEKNGGLNGPGMIVMITPGADGPVAHAVARSQPLSKLTSMMGVQIGRPVLDKTGLNGLYDFSLEFTPDLRGAQVMLPTQPGDKAGVPGPDVAAAVQRQLGLRLVANRAKLDVIVVDKVEKVPVAN